MRKLGEILLISCYELGHQPLGIAWAAGFLKRAGFQPAVMDIAVEPFDEAKVRAARFVGISVPMHTALRLGVRVAKRVRELHPACDICFFGLYASLNADYLLSTVANSVIGGESEETLVEFVQALEGGRSVAMPGVIAAGHPQEPVLRRLAFPLPDRRGLAGLKQYAQLEYQGARRLAGYVEAGRGCLHHCLHCPIPPVYGGRFFVIPKDVVLEDIRRQVAAGARHITFGDPDFLNGPGHSLAIVRAMHQEFPELTFDFTAKIEHIVHKAPGIFPELASLGCLFVISAVESLSDEVLRQLEKGHTRQEVSEALVILRQAGIALRPSWVAFTPWTTLEDYLDMIYWIQRERLIDHVDPVHYAIRLLIPPGSALLARGEVWRFLGPLDQANFYYPWTHPDPRVDELHRQVSQIVEQAAMQGEDSWITFGQVRVVALQVAGRPTSDIVERHPPSDRKRAPRLTEAWFCCAEPTEGQLASVKV